jgi:Recombination endonuclease VII
VSEQGELFPDARGPRKRRKRTYTHEYYLKHKARVNEIKRAWKMRNAERVRKQENERRRRRSPEKKAHARMVKRLWAYGLNRAEFELMFTEQQGMCKICGSPMPKTGKTGAQVDHDHVTGKVRALLCMNCNNGIGALRDDPELMLKAAAYVQSFSAQRNEKTEIHPMLTEVA